MSDQYGDTSGFWKDVPGLSVTLTTSGYPLLCLYSMNLGSDPGVRGATRLVVDGVGYENISSMNQNDNMVVASHAQAKVLQLSPGTHSIKVQWKSIGGNIWNLPAGGDYHRRLIAVEIRD